MILSDVMNRSDNCYLPLISVQREISLFRSMRDNDGEIMAGSAQMLLDGDFLLFFCFKRKFLKTEGLGMFRNADLNSWRFCILKNLLHCSNVCSLLCFTLENHQECFCRLIFLNKKRINALLFTSHFCHLIAFGLVIIVVLWSG